MYQLEDVARVQNPVKIRVVFSANEFVIISNRDQETQTKPETSEDILESSDASSVAVLKFLSTPCTLYSMYLNLNLNLIIHLWD